jgi:hypothetical protein
MFRKNVPSESRQSTTKMTIMKIMIKLGKSHFLSVVKILTFIFVRGVYVVVQLGQQRKMLHSPHKRINFSS